MFWSLISALGLAYVLVLIPFSIHLLKVSGYERTANFLWFFYGMFLMYMGMLLW